MPPETPLDAAFRAQEAEPEAEAPRLRFHERILDTELFLLLETEPTGEILDPRIFDLDEGRFVLAFDRDDRLASVLDAPAPYAALPGRRLVAMLAGQGIGIGLNLGDWPSATLLPAAAIDWMAERASSAALLPIALPDRIVAPRLATPDLIAALDPKLAAMAGVIAAAHLVAAIGADGREGLLLALVGVAEPVQDGVARALAETMALSEETPPLDIAFLPADAPALARIARIGLEFELPRPVVAELRPPAPPGSDPDRPPILR